MKYFTLSEFDSPDEPGSSKHMNEDFLFRLDYARHKANTPFVITSGYRSEAHNNKVSKIGERSPHRRGLAADISTTNSRSRFLILQSLMGAGFTRIGIGKDFIHVDSDHADNCLLVDLIWHYY